MVNDRPYLLNLLPDQLRDFFNSNGEPGFRAAQMWQGLYRNFWLSADEYSMFPSELRSKISDHFTFSRLTPVKIIQSKDKYTQKVLFHTPEGNPLETVLMKYDRGNTLCISSQSGCAMGCVFCATGQLGFKKNLSSGEIIEQVLYFAYQLKGLGESITNIVVMGMGEPFHNYQATLDAIDRLNDPAGMNLGARRFTISTVGLIPGIRRFTKEKRQINLAVSLHAAEDELRSSMLPVNRKYPLQELLLACKDYVENTGRRITFEWALIQGVNDSPSDAKKLAQILKGLICHVNVIPLNPTQKFSGTGSTRERAYTFQKVLEDANIPCTIRVRRGIEIAAGCGQLAGNPTINNSE